MAVVGEEGRSDDVMREDHELHTEAVTVNTYVCIPFSTGGFFLASSHLPLREKKNPKSGPLFQYIAVYRSCKHTGTQSIFLSNCVPVYI